MDVVSCYKAQDRFDFHSITEQQTIYLIGLLTLPPNASLSIQEVTTQTCICSHLRYCKYSLSVSPNVAWGDHDDLFLV